ncbi:PP0621 family protein [Pseudorhodoferax sp.]|uniref:PP0621 family protein n=1 Tax=Pseudorhodoferax sp. TaxID=1993553 RepID=UPI002DD61BB4|nr:PP0621 family protein [Pseudorhodoferax sp.]
MKFLIVLLVVAFGIWLWRSRRPPPPAGKPRSRNGLPAEMVRCAVCGLHLPLADAERSPRGVYCSKEHRRQIEG